MWALAAVVLDHVPVSSVARILGVAWHKRSLLRGHLW
jgi:hypothetical protein